MKTASVTYCGVPMQVAYSYTPAEQETRIDPGYPEDVTLESCLVGGVEVIDLLTPEQIVAVEWTILEARGDDDYNDAAEDYHRQRDERAMEGFLG